METNYVYNEEIRQKIKHNLSIFEMIHVSSMGRDGNKDEASRLLCSLVDISEEEAVGVVNHRDFYFDTILRGM